MSEQDQDKVIGSITRKLIWRLVVPVLVIILGQGYFNIHANNKKADEAYVEAHYAELYHLTAELSTTLSMYMQSNDKDKELLRKRMDYLIERMDKFTDKDVKRGEMKFESNNRKYGLEYTPLI